MQPPADVAALATEGQFRRVLSVLNESPDLRRTPALQLLEAEALMETGNLQRASLIAERAREGRIEAPEEIKALRILGQISYYQGFGASSNDLLRRARALAYIHRNALPELYAGVLLTSWRLLGRVREYQISETEFNELRRAVLRSGSAHCMIELRVGVAEIEARKSNTHEALRHLESSRLLLESYPNSRLEGLALSDTGLVFSILGDVRTALDWAERAVEQSAASGHLRVHAAAQINVAHLYEEMGECGRAELALRDVLRSVGPHVHLRAAALDGLANVALSRGDVAGARSAFAEFYQLWRGSLRHLSSDWFLLSVLFSRARLLEISGNHRRAFAVLRRGLHRARTVPDRVWEDRIHLYLSRIATQLGDKQKATDHLLQTRTGYSQGPKMLADACGARASLEQLVGNPTEVSRLQTRSERIEGGLRSAAGRRATPNEFSAGMSGPSSFGFSSDDAVALIELAGYPHVLAREAFALLEMSGAAEKQTLITRSAGTIRCVDVRGWTEAEALAIAKDPADRLQMICGTHRDETWELLAEPKPGLHERCNAAALQKLVDTAMTLDRFRREEKQRAALWPADTMETDGGLWVSEQMLELLGIARRIAGSDITVLVTGETGTGKEVFARAIHRASARAPKPFVAFNCTAVPRDMLESQLFGYRKGAFTGADVSFDGVIRGAAGGTLFLDEIAEIGPELQPKLLRFLETHEVHGLGEAHPVKVDVRVIAATNADVEALVAAGRFREDLFYRLNVARLRLPPLRERREEIPPLIEYYVRKFSDEQKKGHPTLDDETLEYLVLYAWPGNVRQLVNEISRMIAFVEADGRLTPAFLSPDIQASRRTVRVQPGDEPEIRIRLDQPLNDAVDAIEQMMIRRALERAHGNYENAARLLGISRKGLFLKRRRWGLERAS